MAILLLPVDQTIFTNFDDALELEVATPVKGDLVLTPQTKFETWAVFAYNSVVQRTDTNGLLEHRMYYDCIAGSGVPPGRRGRRLDISHRYVCLAISVDGLIWERPILNVFAVNGSKSNNILLEDSGVSVFYDPIATSDTERWKMVCSNSAYSSEDGLHWKKLPFVPIATDDTKPTAYYDPSTKKYAIVVRRDLDAPSNKSSDVVRYIGRCDTTNLSDWQESTPDGCPAIFGVDDVDPDHVDIYTNAWTPYPSIEDPSVHLYFPSYYSHFTSDAPYGFGNDGLLDVRLLVSRDGYNLTYVPGARNSRSPFVSLGINKCGASTPSIKNGWCNPYNGIEQHTAADTSAIYMASGYISSNDDTEVYLYASAQPFTHGGDAGKHLWGQNTGIRVVRIQIVSTFIFCFSRIGENDIKISTTGTLAKTRIRLCESTVPI